MRRIVGAIVGAIVGKELREIWRDPLSLSLSLLLPLVLLALFAYGLNFDVGQVRLGVYDNDRGASSRDYLASLTASGDLVVWAEADSVDDLEHWLDRGSIDAGLIVPPDCERALKERRSAEIEALVDGSFPPRAKAVLAQLDAAAGVYSQGLLTDRSRPARGGVMAGPMVVAEPRVWFNPDLKSTNYIVPGLFSLILMTFTPLLSTLAIVRERERGSIQQVLAAPVSPLALILGKAVPYSLLGFVDMLLVLAGGLLWFQVPFRGSLVLFLLASVIFVFCAVGIGLLISTVTRSQVVAILLALAVTVMPSFLFSGLIFPIYSLPVRYQWVSLAFPARHFTEISRGLALRAAGPEQLWPHFLALVVIAAAVASLTVSRFHRRIG